jgi:hypothetical protein
MHNSKYVSKRSSLPNNFEMGKVEGDNYPLFNYGLHDHSRPSDSDESTPRLKNSNTSLIYGKTYYSPLQKESKGSLVLSESVKRNNSVLFDSNFIESKAN